MQSLLDKIEQENNIQWFTALHADGIPLEHRRGYYYVLNQLIAYYGKFFRKNVFGSYDKPIIYPITIDILKNYLSGYEINYVPFHGHSALGSGYWVADEANNGLFTVYYNVDEPKKRQRFTMAHETIHICQSLDENLLNYLDDLIVNSTLPPHLISRVLEKATDKAVAMYFMPREDFEQKWSENKDIQYLSNYFQVSTSSITYRLKECGINLVHSY